MFINQQFSQQLVTALRRATDEKLIGRVWKGGGEWPWSNPSFHSSICLQRAKKAQNNLT
jgi:hypothetical protein